jgi:hypothetical protein
MNIKFVRGSEILDNILNNQRSPDDKTGLGYKESLNVVKGESSINMSTTEKPTSYANALKGNNSQPNKSGNEKKK